MHFIEHIIEPTKLFLTWRSSDESCGTRFIVAELNRAGEEVTLTYLNKTKDFSDAEKKGFSAYPAFQNISITHHNVIDAFMRRLPPRSRGDFSKYLEGFRLKPSAQLSDFALLGYSGARLLADGFSIIHPFENVSEPCGLLLEATGYRKYQNHDTEVHIGDIASFYIEHNNELKEDCIRIAVGGNTIGYVTRALIPTLQQWLKENRVDSAQVEKINGVPGKPTMYLFLTVLPR